MLQIKKITFSYQTKPVLRNLNLLIQKGEHVSIIGESGSGKSTLLKLIYGTYDLDEGQIFWGETEILGPKYNLVIGYDFMKYVAQEFELMPFISVAENIGHYLSNFFPEQKEERILELLEVVELTDFAKTKANFLSGGQKQRVSLAKALAKDPELILLDEPFSHIDNFKKHQLRRRLFKYLKQKQITCVVATHDKEDVLGYADNIIALHDSRVIATEKPEELYRNPKLPLIAAFFGEYSVIEPYGIIYAHQLQVVDNSDIEVVVANCYFKGDYYLIEANYNENKVYFQHHETLGINDCVFIKETN